jgi:DNA (cytosine-5)-methyltransferase 1
MLDMLASHYQLGILYSEEPKFRRLSFSEPSLTLRCGEIFFHPVEDRYLTPREYMRIHGYPDDYVLKGPIRSRSGRVRHLDQHRQVANSVPPPVAYAISKQIVEFLGTAKFLDKPVQKELINA